MSSGEHGANHPWQSQEGLQPLPVDDDQLSAERERLAAELNRLEGELRQLRDELIQGGYQEDQMNEWGRKRNAEKQLKVQLFQLDEWMRLEPERRRRETAERERLEEERERLAAERQRPAAEREQMAAEWESFLQDHEVPSGWETRDGFDAIFAETRGGSGRGSGSEPDPVAIDLGVTRDIAVLVCAWVAAPYVQGLAGQAANGTYQVFANKLRSILSGREVGPQWDLLILREPGGKLKVEIPSNLPEEVHAALVRDFVDLVGKAPDAEPIHIIWDERDRAWIKAKS
ncbi:hypothetical protein ACFXKK_34055 [Streptomyces globisporus]|uniref:hypothetical protein n=1 Tax=Streptomyces globisporus TaxID=1908 RepID=UPI00364CFE94